MSFKFIHMFRSICISFTFGIIALYASVLLLFWNYMSVMLFYLMWLETFEFSFVLLLFSHDDINDSRTHLIGWRPEMFVHVTSYH